MEEVDDGGRESYSYCGNRLPGDWGKIRSIKDLFMAIFFGGSLRRCSQRPRIFGRYSRVLRPYLSIVDLLDELKVFVGWAKDGEKNGLSNYPVVCRHLVPV